MEILEKVMTARTITSPLQNDREVRVRGGDIDDLADVVNQSRLEGYVFDASGIKAIDDFDTLFYVGNTSRNTESFDR